MGSKNIVTSICAAFVLFAAGCSCEDEFGEFLDILIPIESSPAQTTFTVGDTISYRAGFSTDAMVDNSSSTISIAGFDLFTAFGIQEISSPDTVDFGRPVQIIQRIGEVGQFGGAQPLYPLRFEERDDSIMIDFGVVVLEPGLYSTGFNFLIAEPEDIDHPLARQCGDGPRRNLVKLFYINPSTDRAAYDSLYLSSLNPDIQRLGTWDRYRLTGSTTFRVLPE